MRKVAVKVLFFARAKDICGKREDTLCIPVIISYQELCDLIVRHFSLQQISRNFILAINEQYSDANIQLKLKEGDIIAVIPPLSGGAIDIISPAYIK